MLLPSKPTVIQALPPLSHPLSVSPRFFPRLPPRPSFSSSPTTPRFFHVSHPPTPFSLSRLSPHHEIFPTTPRSSPIAKTFPCTLSSPDTLSPESISLRLFKSFHHVDSRDRFSAQASEIISRDCRTVRLSRATPHDPLHPDASLPTTPLKPSRRALFLSLYHPAIITRLSK